MGTARAVAHRPGPARDLVEALPEHGSARPAAGTALKVAGKEGGGRAAGTGHRAGRSRWRNFNLPGPLIVGGRSAGARGGLPPRRSVPPRCWRWRSPCIRPASRKTRADEFAGGPALTRRAGSAGPVQPAEFPPGLDLVAVPGDHSLRKGLVEVVAAVLDFV